MALTGTYSFRGFSVQGAYVQARGMMLVGKSDVRGRGVVWASEAESKREGGEPLDTVTVDFELSDLSTPIYTAAYAALAGMPQFQGWTNC